MDEHLSTVSRLERALTLVDQIEDVAVTASNSHQLGPVTQGRDVLPALLAGIEELEAVRDWLRALQGDAVGQFIEANANEIEQDEMERQIDRAIEIGQVIDASA